MPLSHWEGGSMMLMNGDLEAAAVLTTRWLGAPVTQSGSCCEATATVLLEGCGLCLQSAARTHMHTSWQRCTIQVILTSSLSSTVCPGAGASCAQLQ
jgi:hypothetical protein